MSGALRRPITRAALDAYYAAHKDGYWDFAILPIYDNGRLADLAFDDPAHEDHARLTRAQQVLVGLQTVDSQIENGGMEQLVFNFLPELPWLRASVVALGYAELTCRFDETIDEVFDEKTVKTLRASADGGHDQAWANVQAMYREFDCDVFNAWYCERQNHAAIMDAIERYIRTNEADLFEIAG